MPKNGLRLFRLFGIEVYLHWAWIIVAVIELQTRQRAYHSNAWNVVEYLSLFVIVLMHEFGHALACKSVGGRAERIILWPLGGVAFVSPPQRPGAVLWSIVAGPLVNVLLLPVTYGLYLAADHARHGGAAWVTRDMVLYLQALALINLILLVFNLMPAYPLDGGQILRAVLWFFIGPVNSLRVACVVGFFGAAGVLLLALHWGSPYMGFMGAFMGLQSWTGLQRAGAMARQRDAAHEGFACPACGAPPPAGPFWRCACGNAFDTFATNAACPDCGRVSTQTGCPRCGTVSPRGLWGAGGFEVLPPRAPGRPGAAGPWAPGGGQTPAPWAAPAPPPPPPGVYPPPPPLPPRDGGGGGEVVTIPPAEAVREPGSRSPGE